MNQRLTPRTTRNPRRGFTLIEMLLVIVIIGILAALILPAVQSARNTAQNTAVRAEIAQLEAAIANFKATYGIDPPSSIKIFTTQTDWNDSANAAHKAVIRRIWPNFNFNGAVGTEYPSTWTGAPYNLTGQECLVFFLGGVASFSAGADGKPGIAGVDDDGAGGVDDANELGSPNSDDAPAFTGFSKNPAAPFTPAQTGEVRQGPFFEFQAARARSTRIRGFATYKDSLPGQTNPYGYISSNDGRGYQPLTGEFVYLIAANSPHKPKSFQIISPGMDGEFGSGGIFDPTQTNSALTDPRDRDNITNLASGRLAP